MDSYEWNKIAGWVLAATIAVLGLAIGTSYLFPVVLPETPAYVVQGVELDASADAGPAEAEKPIAFFLASANAERGANAFKKCAACHSIEKGGATGIGPNLWGIIGAKHAHVAGFAYSTAMAETGSKIWDWDSLDAWIANPRKYMPGNKMSFAGVGRAEERADLLAFLNSMSDAPKPLPAVPAEAEPAADAADPAPLEPQPTPVPTA